MITFEFKELSPKLNKKHFDGKNHEKKKLYNLKIQNL